MVYTTIKSQYRDFFGSQDGWRIAKSLVSQLPAFIHFLANWKIPEHFQHGRFGVKTWHHPELLAALDALAGETRLLSLIGQVLFADMVMGDTTIVTRPDHWKGTAEKLERELCDSPFSFEAKKLLYWPTAAGTFLSRLAKKRPDRVERARSSDSRDWVIKSPERNRRAKVMTV